MVYHAHNSNANVDFLRVLGGDSNKNQRGEKKPKGKAEACRFPMPYYNNLIFRNKY